MKLQPMETPFISVMQEDQVVLPAGKMIATIFPGVGVCYNKIWYYSLTKFNKQKQVPAIVKRFHEYKYHIS